LKLLLCLKVTKNLVRWLVASIRNKIPTFRRPSTFSRKMEEKTGILITEVCSELMRLVVRKC
jgi:hypothetical protein